MGIHYPAIDKSAEAEKRFERAKLHSPTEKAWQAYANAQEGHIADMGDPANRTKTNKGLWSLFLANIVVPGLHSQAFHTYMADKATYDALPVQGRITKLSPEMLTYIKALPADPGQPTQATGSRRTLAPATPQASRLRDKRRAETAPAHPGQRQRIDRPTRTFRQQSESSKVYHAIPTDQDAKSCPEVGYQDDSEPRPYNHSLREQLRAGNRCIVCWSAEHRIHNCPERSDALKAEMDRQWYASNTQTSAYQKPKLEVKTCGFSKDELTTSEEVSQEANLTNLHTGTRTASPGAVVHTGDIRPTGAGEGGEHLHTAHQAGISSGQSKQTACTMSALEMNANSSHAENYNLLMMGTGKTKLATVHYVFDPTELETIANETRPFTRDGYAKGSTYKHPACSKDACYLPEKPFECSDHRGHHCWMDPPVRNIEMALQSYAAAKQYDPSNTSMCILVPVMEENSVVETTQENEKNQNISQGS